MKIINERPPIWDSVIAAGMRPDETRVIFTYGDKIYNPGGTEISEDVMEHEETHSEQQGLDPDAWWARYLTDPIFRIAQESEAYAKQYDFMCARVRDRNRRNQFLIYLAGQLSGPMYGNVIDGNGAIKMIKSKSKNK